jgi:hypothetical protein
MSAPASENAGAPERLLETFRPAGIGAREDEDVGASLAGVDGGLDARDRLLPRDDALPAREAAALRGDLVFDHDAGESRLRVAANSPLHVHRVSVSSVGVADDGDSNSGADVFPLREHLPVGDEPGIG